MTSDHFLCYYCTDGRSTFDDIWLHTCEQHGNQTLKIKSLELNIVSGKIGYWTHNFGIIPSDKEEIPKDIS